MKMKRFKLLLVDDDEEFVWTLAQRLGMRDLGSDSVYDGEQALSFIEQQEPDVMVLDLKMPGMDGMEILRHIRNIYPDLQVIILTAHGNSELEKEALRLGAFDYMEKPVNLDKLAKRVREAYSRKVKNPAAPASTEIEGFKTAGNAGEKK